MKTYKYPHIKKGTLSCQVSIQVINKRGRTGYYQCNKERVCGDDKFDFLFENDDKTICKYDKDKHGTWEIYRREDDKLDVRLMYFLTKRNTGIYEIKKAES